MIHFPFPFFGSVSAWLQNTSTVYWLNILATKLEFCHISHRGEKKKVGHTVFLFTQPSINLHLSYLPHPALSSLLLPACLYLSLMPSAVKWRMLASAGTLAGVASVLTAECILEVLDLAHFQGTDSTIVTRVANIYCMYGPRNSNWVISRFYLCLQHACKCWNWKQ